MKRTTSVLFLGVAIGYFGAYVTRPHVTLFAQATELPAPRAVDGKGMYFSSDFIKKAFPPARNGVLPPSTVSNHLAWDPFYRFTVMRREHHGTPRKHASGEMLPYAGSEMHENKTQIYILYDGSGEVVLGGKPKAERPGPIVDGQHGGGELVGGTPYRVTAGDWLVIPPYTWHIARPDPGQTLSYGMCHIETRRLRP
jgi:mannose-6-phosphate isomerase-like protein (cupin superfamily)